MKVVNIKEKPIFDDIYCNNKCPFFEEYKHPYYSISAWCFKLMKELGYYDYYIAKCQEKNVKGEIKNVNKI